MVVFFDAVDHDWLICFVEHRVGDRRVIRLIRKWLKAGVMEEGEVTRPEVGTPQGGVASPLLANTTCITSSITGLSGGDATTPRVTSFWCAMPMTSSPALNTRPMPSGFRQNYGTGWRSMR